MVTNDLVTSMINVVVEEVDAEECQDLDSAAEILPDLMP
jgi:hypothetical protein